MEKPASPLPQESLGVKDHVTPGETPQPGNQAYLVKNKKKLVVAGVIVILILMGALFFGRDRISNSGKTGNNTNSSSGAGPNSDSSNASMKAPEGAIAKVGEEYIFQEDLDIELANYPAEKNDNTKKLLLDKLVKDSIVLQAADKNKVLALNPAVYNSPAKDYGKRIADVKAIEKKINSTTDQISGGVVSLWFHNYEIPKMGLEKAKQTAFERISALRQRVVDKEITIEEAGNIIKKTPSYGDLDVGYQINAYVPFSTEKGKYVTIDGKFNELLWKTNLGDVTPVFLGWNINGGTRVEEEAFYAFGQISSKIENGSNQDFSKWVDAQKPNYEIKYY